MTKMRLLGNRTIYLAGLINLNGNSNSGEGYLEELINNITTLVKAKGNVDEKPSAEKLEFCSDKRLYEHAGTRAAHFIKEYRNYKSENPDIEIRYVMADDPGYEDGLCDPTKTEWVSVKYKGEEVFLVKYDISNYHEDGLYLRENVAITPFIFLRSHGSEWLNFIKSEADKIQKSQ
jgi:hypothetical protein